MLPNNPSFMIMSSQLLTAGDGSDEYRDSDMSQTEQNRITESQ